MITAANVLFLLSLLPWALFALASALFMDDPRPRTTSFFVFQGLIWTYPVAVVAAVVLSRMKAVARPRLALVSSVSPIVYLVAFGGFAVADVWSQIAAQKQERTSGEVYPCSGNRVVKVREDGSVWLLGGGAMVQESAIGYLAGDRTAFRASELDEDLATCRDAAGDAFLSRHPAANRTFRCIDGSRLVLAAFGEHDFVHLDDDRLPARVFYGRVTDGSHFGFVFAPDAPGPHPTDDSRRAHAATCRDGQGRTLLDLYAASASEGPQPR